MEKIITSPEVSDYIRDVFVNSLENPVWVVDDQLNLLFFNDPFEQIFSLNNYPSPGIGKHIFSGVENHERLLEWKKLYLQAFSKKVNFRLIFGTSGLYEISLKPVLADDQNLLVCTAEKVDTNRDYEKNLSSLLSRIPDIVMFESGGDRHYISPNIFHLIGYTQDELLENPGLHQAYIHDGDRKNFEEKFNDWMISGSRDVFTVEYRVRHRNGHVLWIEDRRTKNVENDGRQVICGFLLDVSSRKGAQAEASFAELKFRAFMDNFPGNAWIKNDQLRYVFCNKATRNAFQLSDQCENGLITDFDIFSPELADQIRMQDETLLKDMKPMVFTERQFINGEERFLQVHKFVLRSGDGKNLAAGFSVDITENIKNQEQLRRNDEQFRLLTLGAHDMISVHSEDSTFGFVSPGAARFTGYTPEQLIGKKLISFIHAEDRQLVLEHFSAAVKGGKERRFIYRMIKQDGHYVWVESLLTFVYEENGALNGFHATTRDISGRKLLEKKLGFEHHFIREVLNSIPVFLFVKDENLRFRFVNKACASFMEMDEESVLLKRLTELTPLPFDADQFEVGDQAILDGKTEDFRNEVFTLPGGRQKTLYTIRRKLSSSDGSFRIVGISTDISPLVESEKRTRAAHDEMKNFIYKASHDLKGPLSSILGLSNLAAHTLSDEEAKKYFGIIGERSSKLSELLDDLLKVAHMTAEKVILEDIDLQELIREIYRVNVTEGAAPALKLSILNETDSLFIGNKSLLTSVFQNLLVNSMKYRHPERSPEINIHLKNNGLEYVITFADNGIGIEEDAWEKIFELFYRAEKQVAGGSGLGLYIVKKSAERMGGDVSLKSRPGEGTIFTLKIQSNYINDIHEKANSTL